MNNFIDNQKWILRSYITTPNIFLNQIDIIICSRILNEGNLLNVTKCPATSTLKFKRKYSTSEITDFIECVIKNADANEKNSTSFKRAPVPEEFIHANAMNFPFWPGGFEEPTIAYENFDLTFTGPKLTIPPGFLQGYTFSEEKNYAENKVDLLSALEINLQVEKWLDFHENNEILNQKENCKICTQYDDLLLEEIQPSPILQISNSAGGIPFSSQWAEIIDTEKTVLDFYEQIPEPAIKYEFELDNFQKQAIIKLENNECVFIAAHTSAGKTVIAEYAIALTQKNMTRCIYTSPIKALSNQKYRDFKKKFKDVGLITGDLQIEPKAACLIMTTEILRSILFTGKDVVRDIEFVIFDEVHYINDPDRGHVWEEVIMLLPDNAKIIMLSATVPNVKDLAEWVGNIKKKRIYVISTVKRPVPLEHYLYVDNGGKNKKNMHLLVDSELRFHIANYNIVKAEMSDKNKKKKNMISNNPKEDQRKWSNLIDYLQKNNKLPVIAFTLSRNRCDLNANALKAKDLNTAKEKAGVHNFFQHCLAKLKPEDKKLDQVRFMEESLERGIGIHHSGILPILKEIVEFAFQSGWVKVLFATETFAMGINMPARSVVFDSFKKHDGTELRCLKPSEYTQMAGRAGRRGNDETGTVIIMCKQQFPSQAELEQMILGKADLLSSKFRLRYAAILKCLCIKSVQIENLMKHSFKEFAFKKDSPRILKLIKEKERKLAFMNETNKSLQPLEDFFDISYEFLKLRQQIMPKMLQQSNYLKDIKPGKVIIVTFKNHYNKLGIILNIKDAIKPKPTTLKVLVLDNQKVEDFDTNESIIWHNMISLTKQMRFFKPAGIGGHRILEINYEDVVDLIKSNIKVESDSIIRNWEQRQIERLKNLPPCKSVQKAVTELYQLNECFVAKPNNFMVGVLKKEANLNIAEVDNMVDLHKSYNILSDKLQTILPYTNIANFRDEFRNVFKKKNLQREIEELKFKISSENLSLWPDYADKLKVLKELGYIADNGVVHFKGKTACVMGQNELFLTELIVSNAFADLEPAEIAALLSGLVFQAKTNVTITAPNEKIKQAQNNFEEIYKHIELTERKYKLHPGLESRLNFGLLEVVYEWAQNKPFSEITKITDIQEGIIVRCIQQLDETITDVKVAAKRFGEPKLEKKMELASTAIKRDIVFTASLYINQ